jgi:hypothetical protein
LAPTVFSLAPHVSIGRVGTSVAWTITTLLDLHQRSGLGYQIE